MRITVLVTAYNLERYLGRCLDSVLAQETAPFEVLLVDDASQDGTSALAQSYCEGRENWHYLRPESNLGVLRATLYGLQRARGEVVSFLDGDDLWEPGKLSRVAACYGEQPDLLLLSHGYVKIDEQDKVLQESFSDTRYMAELVSNHPGRVDQEMRDSVMTYSGLVWLGSAWSLRLSLIDLAGFQAFVQSLPNPAQTYQDHVLAVYCLLHSRGRCQWTPEPFLRYRLHSSNTSGDTRDLERARLIALKGVLTRSATFSLVMAEPGLPAAVRDVQSLRLQEIQFLEALYSRDYARSVGYFLNCFRKLWGWRDRVKESLRLGGCLLLGPGTFVSLKSRLFSP